MPRIQLRLLSCFVVLLGSAGCGRFGPPIPPERVAPKAVRELKGEAVVPAGVTISWQGPDDDRRSKALEDLEGFIVYRRSAATVAELADPKLDEERLQVIPDKAIADRWERVDAAREAGLIGRRVKADPALNSHTFTDSGLKEGISYLYRIVPINHGETEGEVKQLVRVDVRNGASEVSVIDAARFEKEFDFSDTDEEE